MARQREAPPAVVALRRLSGLAGILGARAGGAGDAPEFATAPVARIGSATADVRSDRTYPPASYATA